MLLDLHKSFRIFVHAASQWQHCATACLYLDGIINYFIRHKYLIITYCEGVETIEYFPLPHNRYREKCVAEIFINYEYPFGLRFLVRKVLVYWSRDKFIPSIKDCVPPPQFGIFNVLVWCGKIKSFAVRKGMCCWWLLSSSLRRMIDQSPVSILSMTFPFITRHGCYCCSPSHA